MTAKSSGYGIPMITCTLWGSTHRLLAVAMQPTKGISCSLSLNFLSFNVSSSESSNLTTSHDCGHGQINGWGDYWYTFMAPSFMNSCICFCNLRLFIMQCCRNVSKCSSSSQIACSCDSPDPTPQNHPRLYFLRALQSLCACGVGRLLSVLPKGCVEGSE